MCRLPGGFLFSSAFFLKNACAITLTLSILGFLGLCLAQAHTHIHTGIEQLQQWRDTRSAPNFWTKYFIFGVHTSEEWAS